MIHFFGDTTMNETELQIKFRNEVHHEIEVIRIGGDRYAICVPNELTEGRESRIVLWRDMYSKWWLTDECRTFRKQKRTDTTVLYGVEIRLEVREFVSGGDLKLFISAVEKLSPPRKNSDQRFMRKGVWI